MKLNDEKTTVLLCSEIVHKQNQFLYYDTSADLTIDIEEKRQMVLLTFLLPRQTVNGNIDFALIVSSRVFFPFYSCFIVI